MCKHGIYKTKKQFTVVYQINDNDNVCELNFDLIERLYTHSHSNEIKTMDLKYDLSAFEKKIIDKYNVSHLKELLLKKNIGPTKKDHKLMFFNLFDEYLQIW